MKISKLLPKKTKIVCTIGPASQAQSQLEKMISNGMDIARINFAHGDLNGHRQIISNVRAASEAVGKRVSILGDLPGPKMRIGKLAEDSVMLERGQSFSLLTEDCIGNDSFASMSFEGLPQVVKPGDSIFLNDGFIQLEVEKVESDAVHCQVVVGGELRSSKGVNLPDIDLGISAFTNRDLEFLKFAASEDLDGVSQSFVEKANDIRAVREAARAIDYHPFIIAKIERSRALDNLQEILEATDAIMVARGDLGVEIPIERIATTQKKIIVEANMSGKPVITATQMLESMIDHRRPTRAEATDVANAILDGTDCVMLSGETAVGEFPDEAVNVMAHIAEEIEQFTDGPSVGKLLEQQKASGEITRRDRFAFEIYSTAQNLNPAVVFVPSASGATARLITRFRLKPWIVAICLEEKTCQQLQFSYGVHPEFLPANPESWPKFAQQWLSRHNIDGDLVLVIQRASTNRQGDTARLDFIDLTDRVDI